MPGGNATDQSQKDRLVLYDRIFWLRMPGHPGKLALIEDGGGESKAFPIKCGLELSEYPHWWKEDDPFKGLRGPRVPGTRPPL